MVTKRESTRYDSCHKFCSSEKINGNKTEWDCDDNVIKFCSSEKINGNKTI